LFEKIGKMTEKLTSRKVKIGKGLRMDDILASSSKERHKASLSGVPTKTVNKFINRFNLTRKDLASLLGITERTLYSQLKKDKLDEKTSDRFLLVSSVFEEGSDALMSDAAFIEWIHTSHSHFDKETPFSLLTTINGAEAVREELIRTKYGVLS
jgi:putative toxin-antitoxin system antitoxin component (TIGR02293 family)